jgi:hypothetical protein
MLFKIRSLSEFPDFTLHQILEFAHGKEIVCFRMTCKRFAKDDTVVTPAFMMKLMETRHGLPPVIFKLRYSIQTALKQLVWKGKLRRSVFDENHVDCQMDPFEIHSNTSKNFSFDARNMCIDEKYVLTCADYDSQNVSAKKSFKLPAIVRDSKSFEMLGYLPYQSGFVHGLLSSEKFGKVAVVVTESGIFITHLEKKLFKTLKEMEMTKASVSEVSKKVFYLKDSAVCANIAERRILWSDGKVIHAGVLTDEVLDYKTKEKLKTPEHFVCPTDGVVVDAAFDLELDVLVCLDSKGNVCTWSLDDLNHAKIVEFAELWPLQSEMKDALICVKDGFVGIQTVEGRVGVLKWDGKTFQKWRLYHDNSRIRFNLEYGLPLEEIYVFSMDINCGFMASPDASGLGMCVWDLMDPVNSEVGCLTYAQKQMEYEEKLHCHEVQCDACSSWSYDGGALLMATTGPCFWKFDLKTSKDDESFEKKI